MFNIIALDIFNRFIVLSRSFFFGPHFRLSTDASLSYSPSIPLFSGGSHVNSTTGPLWPKTAFHMGSRHPWGWHPLSLQPTEPHCHLHRKHCSCISVTDSVYLNVRVHLFLLASLLWFQPCFNPVEDILNLDVSSVKYLFLPLVCYTYELGKRIALCSAKSIRKYSPEFKHRACGSLAPGLPEVSRQGRPAARAHRTGPSEAPAWDLLVPGHCDSSPMLLDFQMLLCLAL